VFSLNDSHVVIQGPPGTGKTFTSAHAIVQLLKAGKRVGVQAMTHKAINNLLRCVEEVADEQGFTFRGVKKASDDDDKLNGRIIEDVKDNKKIDAGQYQLIGGTAWFFSRQEMDQQLDYLFIDEAGQESLAKVVAAGASAKNIVLVGDQMQLSQPVKGAHPGGSGVSALEYLMAGWATVPPDRGILLSKTWRMHPELCRFVSEAFYEGRLEPDKSTARQRLLIDEGGADGLAPVGLTFVEVEHEGNSQRSAEEAERLREMYALLVGREWVDQNGEVRPITTDDILVVSPYNMQVDTLVEELPAGARVGTVDRFQGQEAALTLLSMAASDSESAPRGMEFLYSRNRMNVAISRGRCAAAIVGSTSFAAASCRSIEQIKLVNTLCWARQWGRAQSQRSTTKALVPTAAAPRTNI
jgi:superfamily I DNA and/or RNA helicase